MSARRLTEAGLAAPSAALGDLATVNRWREKVVNVEGSESCWQTGAISGRGYSRFYFAPGRVTIAHGFALRPVHGAQVLNQVRVLGHRCDNLLCQRVHPEHLAASSHAQNRREWAAQRELSGSPLDDI